MINIKELRIGNLVSTNGKPCNTKEKGIYEILSIDNLKEYKNYLGGVHITNDLKYDDYYTFSFCDFLEPIILTDGILLKCGFTFKDNAYYSPEYCNGNILKIMGFDGNYRFSFNVFFTVHIKYLHQFQNIYYALTGKELELK